MESRKMEFELYYLSKKNVQCRTVSKQVGRWIVWVQNLQYRFAFVILIRLRTDVFNLVERESKLQAIHVIT